MSTVADTLPPRMRGVAIANAIGHRPVRIVLEGEPVVLFRTAGQLTALADKCPHRGAPLSLGRVRNGGIVCPYHGWQFGADGICTAMPSRVGDPAPVAVPRYAAAEHDGVVFVGAEDAAPPRPMPDGFSMIHRAGSVRTTVADLAENILDTTHTQTLHAGLLRRESARRLVRPDVAVGEDWIEARYPPEAAPSGLPAFLSGGGYAITDRFEAPGVASVTYKRDDRIVFAARFHMTPSDDGHVGVVAAMGVPKGPFAHLQTFVIGLFMSRIFRQDTKLLHATACNGAAQSLIMPEDLLRRGIDAILRGEAPQRPATVPDLLV
ncbi:MAG: Rieske 2Fe-2S domain-containing protein [Pseudomonadota bacterium]